MRNWRRMIAAALIGLTLSGCFGGGDRAAPRPAPFPIRERPGGPVTLDLPPSAETQQCFTDLARADVRYTPVPDRDYGSGCIVAGAVSLNDIGVPVTGLKEMRCPLARAFTAWVRHAVAPAAWQVLGSRLVRVETYGTYACRGVVGRGAQGAAKLSEHGRGNAVDVAAFVLADGRKITIETGWGSPDLQVRAFLQTIHKSACRRFQTVLSPDYNAAHYNHLHLDMGTGPFCR